MEETAIKEDRRHDGGIMIREPVAARIPLVMRFPIMVRAGAPMVATTTTSAAPVMIENANDRQNEIEKEGRMSHRDVMLWRMTTATPPRANTPSWAPSAGKRGLPLERQRGPQ